MQVFYDAVIQALQLESGIEVETIQCTEALNIDDGTVDTASVRKDNTKDEENERGRGTESRSVSQHIKYKI